MGKRVSRGRGGGSAVPPAKRGKEEPPFWAQASELNGTTGQLLILQSLFF